MDPLSVINTFASAAMTLYEVVSKVKDNREQCVRLCGHLDNILDTIESECKEGLPPRLAERIIKLTSALSDLTVVLEGLQKSSFFQRVIWRNQIGTKIQELYKDISKAMEVLKLGTAFDMNNMLHENENARQEDAAAAQQNFDRLSATNQQILEISQVNAQQLQEIIVALGRYIGPLPASSERRYLENGMHALQRRSGPLRIKSDDFVITSLDVIIDYDKKLGQGGFASVYEAHWTGIKVAVKVMDRGVPASALEREVDVWKRLRHPHILQFFGACSIADPPFMVCAYKQNGDAVDYLLRFPRTNRVQLLYEAASGLTFLHANGVIHGDIKASNILMDEQGKACLSDFGLSRIKTNTTTIRQGAGIAPSHGTARWMSPEHITLGVANKKTDVYSFGMTMYEVFADSPPFAATPEDMLFNVICVLGTRPPRPEEQTGLNDDIWDIMSRTWAHQPERRPPASDILSLLTRHTALVAANVRDRTRVPVTDYSPTLLPERSPPRPSGMRPGIPVTEALPTPWWERVASRPVATPSHATTAASASGTGSSTYSAPRLKPRADAEDAEDADLFDPDFTKWPDSPPPKGLRAATRNEPFRRR
ncbi:kinase-like protein [Phanerochaete sordida]|uniref:Kinase-like protein n=1 Tax=Phanerochaete sordida TaxID=48140 RepID=A0A9P3GMG1_9APHY|nr:kinase-like protein [Phanerochaete sordida]